MSEILVFSEQSLALSQQIVSFLSCIRRLVRIGYRAGTVRAVRWAARTSSCFGTCAERTGRNEAKAARGAEGRSRVSGHARAAGDAA